jgi:hypothetical protein
MNDLDAVMSDYDAEPRRSPFFLLPYKGLPPTRKAENVAGDRCISGPRPNGGQIFLFFRRPLLPPLSADATTRPTD